MLWLAVAIAGSLAGLVVFKVHQFGQQEKAIDLDKALTQAQVNQVIGTIMASSPPATAAQLQALATQYPPGPYPFTNYALHYQAWVVAGGRGQPPAAPVAGQLSPWAPPPPPPMTRGSAPVAVGASAGGPPKPASPSAIGDVQGLVAQAVAAASSFFGTAPGPAEGEPAVGDAPVAQTSGGAPAIAVGNGAAMSAGPGWTAFPHATTEQHFIWQGVEVPDSVREECARLGQARLEGEFIAQGPEGVWKFQGIGGIVLALRGRPAAAPQPVSSAPPAATQTGSGDTMPNYATYEPLGVEIGAVPVAAVAEVVAPLAASAPRGKGAVVVFRPEDKALPRSIAVAGSGKTNVQLALPHLIDINPHLAHGGVIRGFKPGDRINVPDEWAPALKAKGFLVEVAE